MRKPRVFPTPARVYVIPEYHNSPFEAYATIYLKKNFWRCQKTMGDWEDAMSEAALCYYDCRRRYGQYVGSPQHFMSLFKLVLRSRIVEWANKDSRKVEIETQLTSNQVETESPWGGMLASLQGASNELKQVLNTIFCAPAEIIESLAPNKQEAGSMFFRNAVLYSGVERSKIETLEQELRTLLE